MLIAHLFAVAAAVAAPKLPTPVATVEGITEYRLPNGLRVVLVPDQSKPTTTVNLTVFVGSRFEAYGEKGMAHLLEHLLFKETKRNKDIKKQLTELGGEANGSTDWDRTNYFESFPSSEANLKKAIDIESDRLVNTITSREKLATEMTVVRNEFEMGENQPVGVLMERVLSAAFVWHAYGHSPIGPKSDIELVPEQRIKDFYATYYQPDNAMIVVAGKFDVPKTLQLIVKDFGPLPKPKRVLPTTYTVEPAQDGERSVTIRRVGGTPTLIAGYHIPAATDPDSAAASILSRVLGQMPSGRLAKELIDTKRASATECQAMSQRETGYMICFAVLRANDPSAPARDAMLGALEGLDKKPITAEEVERGRAEMLKQYELIENGSDRVGIMLSEFAAQGDWRMLFVLRDALKKVTVDDVNRVAKKYLIASNRTYGEYVPTPSPVRAEVPAAPDVVAIVNAYKSTATMTTGETFDASPANLDARTKWETLPGGAKLALLAKTTRGSTVNITLALRYGTEASLKDRDAAAEVTSQLLLRGTKTKTRAQVSDALDKLKAQVQFQSHGQGMFATIEVRKPQLAATLALVGEALKEPALDAKEFDVLKRETITMLEQQKEDPMMLGMTGTQRMLSPFPKGHPYYVPTIEEKIAEVNALKVEQVRDFYGKFFGGQNALIAVVGDVDASEIKPQLVSLFGSWKAPEAYVRIPRPYRALDATAATVGTPDKPMAFFGIGEPVQLKDTDADYPAMLMANFMLGGGFMAGRVTQRLREKEGLSYGAGTMFQGNPLDDGSQFFGFAIYNPINVTKVEKGFREELEKAVATGFTAQEITLARDGLLAARAQHRADDRALSMELVQYLQSDRKFAFDASVDGKIKSLSAADVNASLKKHLDPKRLLMLKVGDFKTAPTPK